MSRALRIVLLAVLSLVAGCTTTRVAYDNAEFLLRWRATSYLDVHGAQAERLDAHIAAFAAWHRSKALPQYVPLVADAQARVARGLTRSDLEWGYDAVVAQAREALRTAGGEIAGLLDGLDAQQIAHLEERIAEDNRKFAKEHLAGSEQERRARRMRRTRENLEEWLGTLTDAQLERVRQHVERAPDPAVLRDQDRRRRQAEFLALVRAGECRQRLASWVAAWDAGRNPAYAAAARAQTEAILDMVHDIARTLSATQRQAVLDRLRGYEKDFAYLARRNALKTVSQ